MAEIRRIVKEGLVSVDDGGHAFNGIPPIIVAMMFGALEVIKLLLALGADVNKVEVRSEGQVVVYGPCSTEIHESELLDSHAVGTLSSILPRTTAISCTLSTWAVLLT